MSKLKIGVLGAGRGKVMMRVLVDHPDAELVAVCDSYEPMLDKARSRRGAVSISATSLCFLPSPAVSSSSAS